VPRVMLIDTDTASDDAVALIMALRMPGVQVAAITTVAGNVDVDRATANALLTVELCGSSVPVHRGATAPLSRALQDARWFHGEDGLGDRGYPPARLRSASRSAVDAIIDTVRAHPGLLVVTLGPLTNLALALDRQPDLAADIGRLVVMGGNPDGVGNVTPAAEFNIWVDPEAAAAVFQTAGIEVELAGWHLCRGDAVLGQRDIDFAIDCNRRAREAYREQTGEDGISLPDPVAMALAIDPSIGTRWSRHRVKIETASELTRGMTVVDRLGVADSEANRAVWGDLLGRPANANVCWTIDAVRWKALLYRTLR
jgi:purine nucleosidase